MLIVAGRPWADRFLTEAWIQRLFVQLGDFFQQRLGLGLGGENAMHRGQGEGTKTDGV